MQAARQRQIEHQNILEEWRAWKRDFARGLTDSNP